MGSAETIRNRGSSPSGHPAELKKWPEPTEKTKATDWLQVALERFRRLHLRQRALYDRLRSALPVIAASTLWLSHLQRNPAFTFSRAFDYQIDVRSLLIVTGIWVVWTFAAARAPLQRRSLGLDFQTEVAALLRGSAVCSFFVYLVCRLQLSSWESAGVGLSLAGVLLALSALLLVASVLVSAPFRPPLRFRRKAIVIGSGTRASDLSYLASRSHPGLEVIGCLDEEYVGANRLKDNYLGTLDELSDLLKSTPIDLVLIGLPVKSCYDDIQYVIRICECAGVECEYLADIFATSRTAEQRSPAPWEIAVLGDPRGDLRLWIKRVIDVFLAAFMLVILSPLMAVIAVCIRLTSPGPALFIQERYGHNRRRFLILKFRTMVEGAERHQDSLEAANEVPGPVFKIKDDPRVTKIGTFLRRTSLDELPQLVNVLRGDMSLVGPRPLAVRDVARFKESWLLRRFSVRPGLTCLWQISGRSNMVFDEWMKLDLAYIDAWSLGLDFLILIRTIPAVLRCSGAM